MTIFRNEENSPALKLQEVEVMAFRVACGNFIGLSDLKATELEEPGRAFLPVGIPYAKDMITVRGKGTSNEPSINDGNWLFFHLIKGGSIYHDRLVLAEEQDSITGDRYTLKKYDHETFYKKDGSYSHTVIRLLPLNPAHSPIVLDPQGRYAVIGLYVGQAAHIQRVDKYRYPDAGE